jgi:hypothetical protein
MATSHLAVGAVVVVGGEGDMEEGRGARCLLPFLLSFNRVLYRELMSAGPGAERQSPSLAARPPL